MVGIAIIGLFLLWLATGGAHTVATTATNIPNPIQYIKNALTSGSSLSTFTLPWQPKSQTLGVTITPADGSGGSNTDNQITIMQPGSSDASAQSSDVKTFGTPSPYKGSVTISDSGGATQGTGAEYVTIVASSDNTAPIDISGWSLQSVVTGVRAPIPRGTENFLMGNLNEQNDLYLSQGMSAVLASGISPVGTSFRENECIGYLGQMQTFNPPLPQECPSAADALPLTADNIRTYGDTCIDFVASLSSCTFPASLPANLSPACHLFLSNNFSYNGCVQHHQSDAGFVRETWRVYLGASGELWRNTHDVIRLLDAQGHTVDVLTY